MQIAVGSKNEVKVAAVREVLKEYEPWNIARAKVIGKEVNSGVSKQPKSLEETIRGALNRAKGAWGPGGIAFGVGIESGLMLPGDFDYVQPMDVCACVFYCGITGRWFVGLSPAWECPAEAAKLMTKEGLDMNEAFHKIGLTKDPKIGSGDGAISIMTKGRLNRKEFTKWAVRMALVRLDTCIF